LDTQRGIKQSVTMYRERGVECGHSQTPRVAQTAFGKRVVGKDLEGPKKSPENAKKTPTLSWTDGNRLKEYRISGYRSGQERKKNITTVGRTER